MSTDPKVSETYGRIGESSLVDDVRMQVADIEARQAEIQAAMRDRPIADLFNSPERDQFDALEARKTALLSEAHEGRDGAWCDSGRWRRAAI